MLFRQLLSFSSLHLFQLAVDDAGVAVADGVDGFSTVVRRWGLREATFRLKCARTRSVLIRCCTGGLIRRHTSRFHVPSERRQCRLGVGSTIKVLRSMSENEPSSAAADKHTSRSETT